MNYVTNEDIVLFRSITGESERRARVFLLRYNDVNQAIDEYFVSKTDLLNVPNEKIPTEITKTTEKQNIFSNMVSIPEEKQEKELFSKLYPFSDKSTDSISGQAIKSARIIDLDSPEEIPPKKLASTQIAQKTFPKFNKEMKADECNGNNRKDSEIHFLKSKTESQEERKLQQQKSKTFLSNQPQAGSKLQEKLNYSTISKQEKTSPQLSNPQNERKSENLESLVQTPPIVKRNSTASKLSVQPETTKESLNLKSPPIKEYIRSSKIDKTINEDNIKKSQRHSKLTNEDKKAITETKIATEGPIKKKIAAAQNFTGMTQTNPTEKNEKFLNSTIGIPLTSETIAPVFGFSQDDYSAPSILDYVNANKLNKPSPIKPEIEFETASPILDMKEAEIKQMSINPKQKSSTKDANPFKGLRFIEKFKELQVPKKISEMEKSPIKLSAIDSVGLFGPLTPYQAQDKKVDYQESPNPQRLLTTKEMLQRYNTLTSPAKEFPETGFKQKNQIIEFEKNESPIENFFITDKLSKQNDSRTANNPKNIIAQLIGKESNTPQHKHEKKDVIEIEESPEIIQSYSKVEKNKQGESQILPAPNQIQTIATKKMEEFSSEWPKFLGSLIVEVKLANKDSASRVLKGDEITFEAGDIDFGYRNISRVKKSENNTQLTKTKKSWYIKGYSIALRAYSKGKMVGYISCEYEEVFFFLQTSEYVNLKGSALCNPNDPESKQYGINRFRVRVDIFLLKMVLTNPLKIMTRKPRSNQNKGSDTFPSQPSQNEIAIELEQDDEFQKRQLILRLTKEAFVHLFSLLRTKISIPTAIRFVHKKDPFQRLLWDKYKKGVTPLKSPVGPTPQLITEEFQNYYLNVITNLKGPEEDITEVESAVTESSDGYKSFIDENESDYNDKKENCSEKDLYEMFGQNSNEFRTIEPPEDFITSLHDYQKQALAWMLFREEVIQEDELYQKKELISKNRSLSDVFQEMVLIHRDKIYFNPFNGEISIEYPIRKLCKGGILADEMGLGKTVMAISLLHTHKRGVINQKEIQQKAAPPIEHSRMPIILNESNSDNDDESFHPTLKKLKITPNLQNQNSLIHEFMDDLLASDEEQEEHSQIYKTESKQNKMKTTSNLDQYKFKGHAPLVQPKASKFYISQDSFENMGFGSKIDTHAGTLIIVPLTLLNQWEAEIIKHSEKNSLTLNQYYGSTRRKIRLQDYDVVLTTYGIIESEYNISKDYGLFGFKWFRIILDEAHSIKSRHTKTARACCGLQAEYRWCLTGTPLQNKLDDLFSILQFLRVEIWGEYFWWNNYINNNTSHEQATALVREILHPILLRRTKKSKYSDGKGILDLPPKEIKTIFVRLSHEERRIYNCFYRKGKAKFEDILGGGSLQYEYAHIFELLIRLRQVCDHPSLVFKKTDLKDSESLDECISRFLEKREEEKLSANPLTLKRKEFKKGEIISADFLKKTIEKLQFEKICLICENEIENAVITSCGHMFCSECLAKVLEIEPKCPSCQGLLSPNDVMVLPLRPDDEERQKNLLDSSSKYFIKSSKLNSILSLIQGIQEKGEKCIIFTQFIRMLDLIEKVFNEEYIEYRRIDGSVTKQFRDRALEEFSKDQRVTVMLISLKSGSLGLNLTAANHVILVDPWWNPAVEEQAIERIYRIGQTRKVSVIRLICSKTIEERILQLNERKLEMITKTIKYTPEEHKRQNLNNIKYVMQDFEDE